MNNVERGLVEIENIRRLKTAYFNWFKFDNKRYLIMLNPLQLNTGENDISLKMSYSIRD